MKRKEVFSFQKKIYIYDCPIIESFILLLIVI